jgi:hypothetical protein
MESIIFNRSPHIKIYKAKEEKRGNSRKFNAFQGKNRKNSEILSSV